MLPTPLPLFSPTALTEAFHRNPTRARKLLGYYLEDLAPQLEQIRQAYESHNLAEVGALAHSLKSSSRQVGAFQLGETAAQLEHAARYAADAQGVATCWQRLQAEFGPTCQAMQSYLATPQNTANGSN